VEQVDASAMYHFRPDNKAALASRRAMLAIVGSADGGPGSPCRLPAAIQGCARKKISLRRFFEK